jgi:hypothetical protein
MKSSLLMATSLQSTLTIRQILLVSGILLIAGGYIINNNDAHSITFHHLARGLFITGNTLACISFYSILAYKRTKTKHLWVSIFLLQALVQLLIIFFN